MTAPVPRNSASTAAPCGGAHRHRRRPRLRPLPQRQRRRQPRLQQQQLRPQQPPLPQQRLRPQRRHRLRGHCSIMMATTSLTFRSIVRRTESGTCSDRRPAKRLFSSVIRLTRLLRLILTATARPTSQSISFARNLVHIQ